LLVVRTLVVRRSLGVGGVGAIISYGWQDGCFLFLKQDMFATTACWWCEEHKQKTPAGKAGVFM